MGTQHGLVSCQYALLINWKCIITLILSNHCLPGVAIGGGVLDAGWWRGGTIPLPGPPGFTKEGSGRKNSCLISY